jgi:hypothetical protein
VTPDRYDVVAPFDQEGLPLHMCEQEGCLSHDVPVETCCPCCPGWKVREP